MRVTYISWAPHCTRSDYTAQSLGGTSHMVYWAGLGSHPATVWLKYIGQSVDTLRVLFRERPDVAFVMSPPPIAIAPVYLYCLLSGAGFVVDAHTGVFFTDRWRLFQGFQYWFCRRAKATIVTSDYLADRLRAQGARPVVIPHVPIEFEPGGTAPPGMDEFTAVFVTSFDRDEPLAAMVEAARQLPDVRFLMTGKRDEAERALPQGLPPNLTLTGFLESRSYGEMLRRAGVVIALTTDEHTMQRAAAEAIYQGTPVIVSNTDYLRQAFDEGAEHVDNSPGEIAGAVLRIRARAAEIRAAVASLRRRKDQQWQQSKAALLAAIGAPAAAAEVDSSGRGVR
jgi:glycosyltransferase involved in cell wall biosynthesis